MSTSDLYIINRKSATWVAEYQNGWGSAPVCWDFLAEKYFPDVNFTDYNRMDYVGHDRKGKMVWTLADDQRLSACEQVALRMTFDHAYVPVRQLKTAGEACREFEELTRQWSEGKANHWRAIGNTLLELSTRKLHHRARGVGLSCTSVNDIWTGNNMASLREAWPILEE